MTPLDFILTARDDDKSASLNEVKKALNKELVISGHHCDFEVLSYYYHNGRMILEIKPTSSEFCVVKRS